MSTYTHYIDEKGLLYIYTPDNRLLATVPDCKNMSNSRLNNLINEVIKNRIGE